MIYTYSIQGMTCDGCRSDVENKLNQIGAVLKAQVNLENGEAVIETNKHISILELQHSLPSKYSISEKKEANSPPIISSQEKSELQQLFPLFLIFAYLTVAAVLLNFKSQSVSGFMLDFMGLFYIVFSFFKLLDLKGFPESFKMYDPLAKRFPVYGWIYPFIELGLGFLFLMRLQLEAALILTIIILGITTLGVTKILLDKKSIQCACLGTALQLPMTKATFIENAVMLIMATFMLIRLFS